MKSAQIAGIDVAPAAIAGARDWLERVSDPSRPGLYAYRPGRRFTPAMTAEAMFVQQLLGVPHDDRRMQVSAVAISQQLPEWEAANTYYWYYATLALFQQGGTLWDRWNEGLKSALLPNQNKSGRSAGSWDPIGEWAPVGGRVYQTALCTLMLEVYYRYLPLYSIERPRAEAGSADHAVGTIRGLASDDETGEPLGGVSIRLDLPDQPALEAVTGTDGRYIMFVPEVPEFFAVSASRSGYLPDAVNVPRSRLRGGTLAQDFRLRPPDARVIALVAVPEVHHLGNNRFEGRINSQFQKEAEGGSYTATFEVAAEQFPDNLRRRVKLTLMAKGVQCPHEIRINGRLLDVHLDASPRDGSFGKFTGRFRASLLHEGTNSIQIRAVSCRGDLDDFEFVNVQFELPR